MNYLLDTSVLIAIRKRKSAKQEISAAIDLDKSSLHITLLSFAEYYYGAFASPSESKEDCLRFLNGYEHLSLAKGGAMLHAELRHKYKKNGLTFGDIDLLNACIAIDNNMSLITADKSFRRIEELKTIMVNPQ